MMIQLYANHLCYVYCIYIYIYMYIYVSELQGNTLVPYLFITSLDYILRTLMDLMKQNGFTLRSRQYPAVTNTDEDDVDDIALLANTSTQAEFLLHSREQAAGGICLHLNADKTYMCFNSKGEISTQTGRSLKLVDKFTYLGSSVSSTEKDNYMRLAKALTAINRLSVIWKSNISN